MVEVNVICENCGENTEDILFECEDCFNQICHICAIICKNCKKYFCDSCYHDHKKNCK